MPYVVPTLDAISPTVEKLFNEVQHFKPTIDGDWQSYLVSRATALAGKALEEDLNNCIIAELQAYAGLYGTVEESDDAEDYWAGFDEQLEIFFEPLIDYIGVMNYCEALPGHDMSDQQTRLAIAGELAEHIKMKWYCDDVAYLAKLQYLRIIMDMQNNGTPSITLDGAAPLQAQIIAPKVPTPTASAAPSLASVKGQPNSQLIGEAFRLLREAFKSSDQDFADHASMSRTTFLNYAIGRAVPKLTVHQADGLRHELDRRIEKIQHVANILAQVTK